MPPPTRGDLPDDVFDVLQRQVREREESFDRLLLFLALSQLETEERVDRGTET